MKKSSFEMYGRLLLGAHRKKGFQLAPVQKRFGASKVTDITPTQIFDLVKPMKISAPGTARNLVTAISGAFKWGASIEGGKLLFPRGNPCNGIAVEKSKVRENVLPDELIPKFWKAVDEEGLVASCALKSILALGQRPGEIRAMRWEDIKPGLHSFDEVSGNTIGAIKRVSHEGAWWEMPGEADATWPGTKNGKPHKVWMTKFALSIIEELGETDRTGYVFKNAFSKECYRKLDFFMRNVCKKMGVQPSQYRPHDLRRSWATMATRLGFSREAMGRVLNHTRPGQNESDLVYDMNKYENEFRKVQEAISNRIAFLVKDEKVQEQKLG